MLYQMLLAVHAGIRSELASVERLAAAVVDGLSVDGLNEELEALRSNSTLWQFQVSCLRYCRFVHSHHHAEDTDFFDELEETNPAIAAGRRAAPSRAPGGLRPSGRGRSSRPSADRQRQRRRSPRRRRRPRGAQGAPARSPRVRGAKLSPPRLGGCATCPSPTNSRSSPTASSARRRTTSEHDPGT